MSHHGTRNEPVRWVRASEAARLLGVRKKTLARWAANGSINTVPLPNGGKRQHRLYDVSSILDGGQCTHANINKPEAEETTRYDAIYARMRESCKADPRSVSTRKQAADLQRQIQTLREYCLATSTNTNIRVFHDIGSGINFHRRGLQALLDAVLEGRIRSVRVAHRDRLCRFVQATTCMEGLPAFAYGLLDHVFRRSGTVIHVGPPHAPSTANDGLDQRELVDDILNRATLWARREVKGCPWSASSRSLAHVFTDRAAMPDAVNTPAKRRKTERNKKKKEQPEENAPEPSIRTYKLQLRTTPAQYNELKGWMAAGRWGYNTMLAAVRDGVAQGYCRDEVNKIVREQTPDWVKTKYRCLYKNAMMDLVTRRAWQKMPVCVSGCRESQPDQKKEQARSQVVV